VKWVVPELIEHGRIIRPGLAVSLAADRIAQRLQLEGALVLDVEPGSAAAVAGIRPTRRTARGAMLLGDLITAIEDLPVRSTHDLLLGMERYKVGQKVNLTVLRDGHLLQLAVQLEAID